MLRTGCILNKTRSQKHTLHCTRQHSLLNEERKKKAVVRTAKPTQEKVFITSYYKQTSNLPLFTLCRNAVWLSDQDVIGRIVRGDCSVEETIPTSFRYIIQHIYLEWCMCSIVAFRIFQANNNTIPQKRCRRTLNWGTRVYRSLLFSHWDKDKGYYISIRTSLLPTH